MPTTTTTCNVGSPPAAVNPLDALPVSVFEEHVGLAGHTRAVSGERDHPHHALEYLVRQEGVSFKPPQQFHAA